MVIEIQNNLYNFILVLLLLNKIVELKLLEWYLMKFCKPFVLAEDLYRV